MDKRLTRSEEAALKAYPPAYTTGKRYAKRVQSELVDTHRPVRAIFQQGYEQAQKEMLEKAVKWLETHRNDYSFTWYNEMESESGITDICIEEFRKAMEEE